MLLIHEGDRKFRVVPEHHTHIDTTAIKLLADIILVQAEFADLMQINTGVYLTK